jgi:multidrug transporter EmrE-like cation transporter
MSSSLSATVNITLATIAEIFGDFGYKSYARTGSTQGFLQGSVGYIGVIYFLIQSLRKANVLYVNGFWDGMSGILESVAAYVILGERFNHPMQWVALGIITVGLVMLRYYGESY